MINIGVLISGGGTNLQAIIDNIDDGKIKGNIKIVVSNRPEAYGLERAKRAGIETLHLDRTQFQSEEEYNNGIIKAMEERDIHLVVLAGYLKTLSKDFIDIYRNRIMNIHPSLIPSFCGKGCYGERVHRMALERGVKLTGATVHFVDEGMDTGPIILQDVVAVEDDDTVGTLRERVLKLEHQLLPKAIALFCDGRLFIKGKRVIIR